MCQETRSIHRHFLVFFPFFFLILEGPPCATGMIRGCPALPDTTPHLPTQLLCDALSVCVVLHGLQTLHTSRVLVVKPGGARCDLAGLLSEVPSYLWRPGVGAQAVCLPFSSVEVWSKQVNASSWPEQNLVSQSAVAETTVCVSRPHLNQPLIVNVWSCLGLGSLPFVLVRAFCLSSPSILAGSSRCLCRSQPRTPCCRAEGWLGTGLPRPRVWVVPGVGLSSVTLGTPFHVSGPLLPHCAVGVHTCSSWAICYLCKPQLSHLKNGYNTSQCYKDRIN